MNILFVLVIFCCSLSKTAIAHGIWYVYEENHVVFPVLLSRHITFLLFFSVPHTTSCNVIIKMSEWLLFNTTSVRRVWRNQRGNQNLYIEEEQTTKWPKEKEQKDKQRSTKQTYKTKDRVTLTPLRNRGWTQEG